MFDIANIDLVTYADLGWWWYYEGERENLPHIDGKFMTFGEGVVPDSMQEIILSGLHEGVTPLVKHTHPDRIAESDKSTWVIIWYSDDSKESLQKLALFLYRNDLIQRTKAGRLYNIAFKYDEQTRTGEYGGDFKAKISLDKIMDLDTGALLP